VNSPRPTIAFESSPGVPDGVPVLGVPVDDTLAVPPGGGASVDADFLKRHGFEGRPGQAQVLLADDGTSIVALGVGPLRGVDTAVLRQAGAALARARGQVDTVATTLLAAAPRSGPSGARAVVEGIGLGAYRINEYRRPRAGAVALARVVVVGGSPAGVRQGSVAVDATCRARDWVNRPARDLTPTRLGELAAELAAATGVEIEVWDKARIVEERLGGLLGVAAGADEEPRLIHLSYNPPEARGHVALVGKGITFDSGGLSLKTAQGMMTMKEDMGGAAAVINAVCALPALRVPVRVSGWVAATENMPSGTATHPGDVLVARNGVSMEVLNTDAEGRLVLADALSLAAEEGPDAIVDIATLTGGQVVALGHGLAALMGNDDALVERVRAAGERAGEPVWPMPLWAPYRAQLDSEVADIKNISGQTAASSIMAALFLQEFVPGQRWAHLDIAGPSWAEANDGLISKGGTGWGVRTFLALLEDWADRGRPQPGPARRASGRGRGPGRR
jgi:leucyl aminopeptidase